VITVYCWQPPSIAIPNVYPLVWAEYLSRASDLLVDPKVSAKWVTISCGSVPPEHRVICFWKAPAKATNDTIEWFRTFWAALKSYGVTPHAVVLDVEDPTTTVACLQVMIRDTMRLAYGSGISFDIPVTNFSWVVAPRFVTFDRNGNAIPKHSIMGVSAPECYPNEHGPRFDNLGKPWRWAAMLDCLNHIRANTGYPQIPWITFCDNMVSVEFFRHMSRTGVTECFWFNDQTTPADELAFSQVMAEANAHSYHVLSLPVIDLKADVVITAEWAAGWRGMEGHT
jgi:hypothetical protein